MTADGAVMLASPFDDDAAVRAVSIDLSLRAADVAVRLADVLDRTCSEESGGTATADFLRSYARSIVPARPGAVTGPIDRLALRFRLQPDEVTLILLTGLADEHEGIASTFRALHPRGEPRPTVGLAFQILGGQGRERDVLRRRLIGGTATRAGLLRLGDGPFPERSLTLADQLWEALHGNDAWPSSLERVDIGPAPAGLEAWQSLPAVQRCGQALVSPEDRTLLVTAPDETIAISRIAALTHAAGLDAVAARVTADGAASALALAHAACRGAAAVLVMSNERDGGAAPLDLDQLPGPILVSAMAGGVRPVGLRPVVTLPLGPIGSDARRRAWRAALPDLAEHADDLAARHPLDPAVTAEIAVDVRSRQRLAGGLGELREISQVIRARAGITLPPGVVMATPDVSWDRLVLPESSGQVLRDAVSRLQHHATVLDDWGFVEHARAKRGVRLMFTGPPGTGKSLAAEVVATAVETDLLVVDVSQLVSKWIGETEKNLAGVFDVAERTQAVLLLDEADSLFTARTEVNDAHDRYANLQTAYLLQRLEQFEGLTVLATNLRQNIDQAFIRRIDYVVEFALPDVDLRHRLWLIHLPVTAPLAADLEHGLLAEMFPVPGAWIRNAAIGGAFLAAADGSEIAMSHVIRAMRREYDKAARPIPRHPDVDARTSEDPPDAHIGDDANSTAESRTR